MLTPLSKECPRVKAKKAAEAGARHSFMTNPPRPVMSPTMLTVQPIDEDTRLGFGRRP